MTIKFEATMRVSPNGQFSVNLPVDKKEEITSSVSTADPQRNMSQSTSKFNQRSAIQADLIAKLPPRQDGSVGEAMRSDIATPEAIGIALKSVDAALQEISAQSGNGRKEISNEVKAHLEITATRLGLLQPLGAESTHFPTSKYGNFLPFQHEQLRMLYKHVTLTTAKGSHPFTPTREFLVETKRFLEVLSSNAEIDRKYYDIPENIQKDKASSIEKDRANAAEIKKNPLVKAKEFQDRIVAQGGPEKAKMAEFAPVCDYLALHLYDEAIIEASHQDPLLARIRKDCLDVLTQVKTNGHVYSEALAGIEKSVAFLDIYERGRHHAQEEKQGCTQGEVSPFYHNLRWRYHANEMKAAAPSYIIYPTMAPLGLADLLKLRAAPLGFVGVETGLHYVDGHSQTPLEFLVHDYNHSRRMHRQQETIAQEMGKSPEAFSLESQKCVDHLSEIFAIKKAMPEIEKDKIRVQKAVIFEVLHEEALPAHPAVIKEVLSRGPNEFSKYFVNEAQHNGKVVYSKDPSSSVLAFVYRKLGGNFYDCADARIIGLGNLENRTRAFIADATSEMCDKLELGIDRQLHHKNIGDDSGLPLGFLKEVEKLVESGQSEMEPLCMDAGGGAKTGFDERGARSRAAAAGIQ